MIVLFPLIVSRRHPATADEVDQVLLWKRAVFLSIKVRLSRCD